MNLPAIRLAPLALLLVLAGGCKEATAPAVATTLRLSASSLTFDALGASKTITAAVLDQRGDSMFDAEIAWSVGGAAVTTSTSGTTHILAVRAVAGGSATVTATAGAATATLAATVTQEPAAIAVTGDAQTGTVNATLAQEVVALLSDRLGAPIAGRLVTFTVTGGDGSVPAPSATTDANGLARSRWTLGTSAAIPQELTVASGSVVRRVVATAVAGPPAKMRVVGGDGQAARFGTVLATAPSVRVSDAFENPLAGVTVTFAVTGGGGSIAAGTAVTNALGIAAAGSWTLGPTTGTNTVTATAPQLPAVAFTATALTFASLGTVEVSGGNNQTAVAGTSVLTAPTVLVRDGAGQPAAGVSVTFAVASGGGTVAGGTALTDATGHAAVGSWTLGTLAAPNTLTARVADPEYTSTPVTFTGIGCTANAPSGFSISVCFTTAMTQAQRDVFTAAAARWAAVITGDIPDFAPALSNVCGAPWIVNQGIDDITIFASIENIDGPGAVLGSAGPCVIRSGSFPLVGRMRFDVNDVPGLENAGQFQSVILHEMGHVLGIGTLWQSRGLLQLPSTATDSLDTYFSGREAIAAFDQLGGASYTKNKVPVENRGGSGTYNSHWREAVLKTELMTGFLNSGVPNPLSILTIASLTDIGYQTNAAAAEPFTFSFSSLLAEGATGSSSPLQLDLGNDVYTGPVHTVGRDGRLTRIR